MPSEKATGRCYSDSYNAMLEFEKLNLQSAFDMHKRQRFVVVHGRVTALNEATGETKPMLHAWVEGGKLVWEPHHQMIWDKREFYDQWKAEVFGKFNSTQASRMILTRKHMGPWAGPESQGPTNNPGSDEMARTLDRGLQETPDSGQLRLLTRLIEQDQIVEHVVIYARPSQTWMQSYLILCDQKADRALIRQQEHRFVAQVLGRDFRNVYSVGLVHNHGNTLDGWAIEGPIGAFPIGRTISRKAADAMLHYLWENGSTGLDVW